MNMRTLENPTVQATSWAWKANSRIPVNPEDAYVELRRIHERDHAVKPEAVVEAATPPDSKLHPAFQWDDGEAAKAYREDQARHLMRSLTITFRKSDGELTPPIRAFVKLVSSADDPALDAETEDATQPRAYLPIRQVMTEDDLRERLKRQAFRELSTWRQRYRDIDAFAQIFEAIDVVAAELTPAS